MVSLIVAGQVSAQSEFGDVELFSTVPVPPGFPEGLAVQDGIVYAAGPAAPGTAGNGAPSSVVAFDVATGEQIELFEAEGEDLEAEHSNTCIAFDNASRLYVLNSQLGVYRIDITTGEQEQYSSALPDIPSCLFAHEGETCSPSLRNRWPMANDIAFDAEGNTYITDSLQATIWKVPAGGGAPEAWFQNFMLNSFAFGFIGVNGIRVHPNGDRLLVTVTRNPRNHGVIYSLPIKDNPSRDDLQEYVRLEKGATPDGIAFGASGRLYVAINSDDAMVLVLNADGSEYGRIRSELFSSPANLAFDGSGNLLIVNHPLSEGKKDPSLFMITKVFVDDTEGKLLVT